MDRIETCCFTGHRPEKLPWKNDENDLRCRALKLRIADEVERAYCNGIRHFMCGMARGADFYFCEAVLKLREVRPDVTAEAVIPCEEQAVHWNERDRERYFRLVEKCDFESMIQQHCDKDCMLRRNRYMVDRSGLLIAAFNGVLGGTMYTVNYAMKNNLEIIRLEIEDG